MDRLFALDHTSISLIIAFLLATFKVVQLLYRIYFHPLSKFPGPTAAALSRRWQEKQVKSGRAEEIYEQLHSQFATQALRTGPNDLHITDPSLYKIIYSQTQPFPKDPAFYDCFKEPNALFTEYDAQVHRAFRKRLNPLFSKGAVAKYEPVIMEKLNEMGAKMRRICHLGPVEVSRMARCMTGDVISELAFGRSLGFINESPDAFEAAFLSGFDHAGPPVYDFYYSGLLARIAQDLIPPSIAAPFVPGLREILWLNEFAKESYLEYTRRTTTSKHAVIFDYMKGLPEQVQASESIDLLIAGTDTTAFTITTGLYHLLMRKDLLERTRKSVDGLGDELSGLEKHEWLTAVVKESLRLAMPARAILPRIVPAGGLVVDGKLVPGGTRVGMSIYSMHTAEEIWGADAKMFKPERWLGYEHAQMEGAFCPFSKGARMCLGMNLATAEIYLTLAYLIRNFDMVLKVSEMKTTEKFIQKVLDPGLLVDFRPREKQ